MSVRRGDVVWSADPFKDEPSAGRPWLVLDTSSHPFADEQSIAAALTTSGHERAIQIDRGDWRNGGVPDQSYALPWAIHSPRHRDVDQRLGRLRQNFVDEIVDGLRSYVERDDS